MHLLPYLQHILHYPVRALLHSQRMRAYASPAPQKLSCSSFPAAECAHKILRLDCAFAIPHLLHCPVHALTVCACMCPLPLNSFRALQNVHTRYCALCICHYSLTPLPCACTHSACVHVRPLPPWGLPFLIYSIALCMHSQCVRACASPTTRGIGCRGCGRARCRPTSWAESFRRTVSVQYLFCRAGGR